jgi:hypothetical protein
VYSAEYRDTGVHGIEIGMARTPELSDGEIIFRLVIAEADMDFANLDEEA